MTSPAATMPKRLSRAQRLALFGQSPQRVQKTHRVAGKTRVRDQYRVGLNLPEKGPGSGVPATLASIAQALSHIKSGSVRIRIYGLSDFNPREYEYEPDERENITVEYKLPTVEAESALSSALAVGDKQVEEWAALVGNLYFKQVYTVWVGEA